MVTSFWKGTLTTQLSSSKSSFLPRSAAVDFLVLHISNGQPRCLNSRRCENENMDKSCNSCCRCCVVFGAWYAFRPERLVVNRSVNEAMPSATSASSPQPLVSGQFYSILHPTEGTATIYQMGDGTRVLRFTSFRTSNGPDVHVYMVAADDAKDVATVREAGFRRSGSHQR